MKSRFGKFLEERAVSYTKLSDQIGISHISIGKHANGWPISKRSAKIYSDFFNIDYKKFMIDFVL